MTTPNHKDWRTPFPDPQEGDACWVVSRFVTLFDDQKAIETHYFKREKAARHYQNRYDDAKLARLVFINGGWVSAPERETGG